MKLHSEQNLFFFDSEGIEKDGCPVIRSKGRGEQVGFVTDNLDFYLDTEGKQIKMTILELTELLDFTETIIKHLSLR